MSGVEIATLVLSAVPVGLTLVGVVYHFATCCNDPIQNRLTELLNEQYQIKNIVLGMQADMTPVPFNAALHEQLFLRNPSY